MMHDAIWAVVQELRELIKLAHELLKVLRHKVKDNVKGGMIFRIGDIMVPISPGNTPKFQVVPSFTTTAFALDPTKASVTSSDPTNFPVAMDPTDTTGTIFEAPIPLGAVIPTGGEAVTVTWTYTNLDGTVATVSGTVTEVGIVDDVTGGTFAQIA